MFKRTANLLAPTRRRVLATVIVGLGGINVALAAGLPYLSGSDNLQKYSSLPATSVDTAQPQAMITLSKDHQLFLRAYNDYTDLDGDGDIETTYQHSFRYYGYFDDNKCYNYASGLFTPAGPVDADRYCSGNWSGNFLNWVSMSRIDVVRKILFGGKRIIDQSITLDGKSRTVLERAYLPNDAHSWAKYYNGSDIAKLTPFSSITTNSATARENGITICNTTYPGSSVNSEDVTSPPLMRVAKGNFSLWAANERWQCLWRGEKSATNDNDPAQSGIPAYDQNPRRSDHGVGAEDYTVRVEVCVSGFRTGDRCKFYPDGSSKPIGLLQEFGDNERMWFGLTTGTYKKNKSGGDVMKRVGTFTDEVNSEVDGRFIATFGLRDADGNINGVQNTESFGLVNALSLYRIIEYDHGDGVYNDCTFRLAEFKNGECKNWGNPLAEAYLTALRWYANLPPSGDFRANDSTLIDGLNQPQSYQPPSVNANNECASLNTVVFNASTISYDGDELDDSSDGMGSINSSLTSIELTNLIGANEGIHGKSFFVGENGQTTTADRDHQLCTAKEVNALGEVRGICPEGPRLEGTFRIAGAAYHAYTGDVNTQNQIGGQQSVKTYAVQLASNTPKIDLVTPSGERSVTLLPACLNLDLRGANSDRNGACAIVDFKHAQPPTRIENPTKEDLAVAGSSAPAAAQCTFDSPSAIVRGKLYINWENGEQGGDYDQDMWGVLDYRISDKRLCITTNTIGYSGGGARMGFGYSLSGTTQDGAHFHSGAEGFTFTDKTSARDCAGGCALADGPSAHTYELGDSSAGLLKDPLWYAAKYGGFVKDPSKTASGRLAPLSTSQWDTENALGEPTPDGNPDNYFFAVEPRQLEDSLRRVFQEIVGQVASGTAAAVVANAREGEGAVYQALFEPNRTDANGNEVKWIGSLQALWVDNKGRLREDNGDFKLGDFAEDPVVELFFDESSADASQQRTRVRRYSGDPADDDSTIVELADLKPLWNARNQLSSLSDVLSQRTYSDVATLGRSIYTWVDLDLDGRVDGSGLGGDASSGNEVKPFVPATFGSGTAGLVNAPDANVAKLLVEYIRGEDKPGIGLRNRTLDYDGDGTLETMRLGDIVNSTPTVVGAPAEAFDLLYDDQTYADFRAQYRNRRNVVYVGANDGMLHAFNAGFYNAGTRQFVTSIDNRTAHPIGAELWAYVPFHNLPHLTWLTDTDYTHVWYMDAKPRIFDARIFDPDDADHPHGWGTVMVVGMGFGGGDISVPMNKACEPFTNLLGIGNLVCTLGDLVQETFGSFKLGSALASLLRDSGGEKELTLRSSYVVMDITNPEKPPELLGEISNPAMGFTAMTPAVIAQSAKGNSDVSSITDDWYLVLGNGPDNLNSLPDNLQKAESTQSAKLWALDLKQLVTDGSVSYLPGFAPAELPNTVVAGTGKKRDQGSFVTAATTADWNLDFRGDALYLGMAAGNAETPDGGLFKVDLRPSATGLGSANPADWTGPFEILNTTNPITITPSVTIDNFGNWWVLSGTGRFYGDPDRASTDQQSLFGIIDPVGNGKAPGTAVSYSGLTDVTNAEVFEDGSVKNVTDVNNEAELVTAVRNAGGWRLNLTATGPAERVVTNTSVIGGVFFASAFTPDTSLCGAQGRSRLFGLRFDTGAPSSQIPTFGTDASGGLDNSPDKAIRSVDIGVGLGSAPSLYVGGARDNRGLTIFTQTSTGAIQQTQGNVSDGARSGELDWRERY
ncbi:pilus assembly protein [Algiphilus sp.]|uniref:pilus assembly protein n=1 Tax=Algiphilus sp. TaxID=1872431 RepID=UPI003B523616